MCKVIRFKKTLCTVHLAAEIRRCQRCSWVVFIQVVFQQYPLLDERTAAGKKLSFAWWLFVVILTVPRNSLKQQCFRVLLQLLDVPFWQTERVTKQNSAPTWQSWCYEGVMGTLKVPTSKPVLTMVASDFRTRFHCCLDYTLETSRLTSYHYLKKHAQDSTVIKLWQQYNAIQSNAVRYNTMQCITSH